MTTAHPKTLTVHPHAALIPLPPESDAASRAILAGFLDLGRVVEPLKVCKGRIVDGRLCQRGALAAGLDEVPAIEVAEEDVATIILLSLTARRHLTKSALAYLALPVVAPMLAECRTRQLEWLRAGSRKKGTRKTLGDSADEIADSLGISRALLFEAKAVRKKLEANPVLRAQWEPKIIGGEMRLAQVQQGLSGVLAGRDGKTTPKNDAGQLMLDLFDTAEVRLTRWATLSAAQRRNAKAKYREQILENLPDELIEETAAFLRERNATHRQLAHA